jgi:chaperonin cofactor prefoldin
MEALEDRVDRTKHDIEVLQRQLDEVNQRRSELRRQWNSAAALPESAGMDPVVDDSIPF